MEDLNTFAADCIVVSCCCNCLFLQIAIFIFLGLPQKLIKNTRKCYREWGIKGRTKRMGIDCERRGNSAVDWGWSKETMSIEMEDFGCIGEVEEALEEFSKNGEFLFGSFWGTERVQNSLSMSSYVDDNFDLRFVSRYEIVEENTPWIIC
ncbi:unnamed protein product [Eruca vesicaria subsp. sativa]|uniref:Transmembrane protein n=1 Tax=Eruca vesicaria subsp. sativa TaxID=29727 RepID=A0ABC8K1F8_ERUVS|nr:unnamed protein product [Eruca vesicaria subsp. sativa]